MIQIPPTIEMQKGAVTVLDVVGWMGIWKNRDDALGELLNLTTMIKNDADLITNRIISEKSSVDADRGKTTEVKNISDTIILLTNLEPKLALEVQGLICQKAIALSIEKRIPLRGAVCYGRYKEEGSILIGPAVDEAASWHENAEWFGCFLTPSAFFLNHHTDMECWKKYPVPIKTGKAFETACVDWVPLFMLEYTDPEKKREMLCKKFIDMGPIIPQISLKYTNTLDYFDACVSE